MRQFLNGTNPLDTDDSPKTELAKRTYVRQDKPHKRYADVMRSGEALIPEYMKQTGAFYRAKGTLNIRKAKEGLDQCIK